MVFRLDDENVGFPNPTLADPNGLLALGGGWTPEWILNAYYLGIFPWYEVGGVPYWYAPEKRMVLFPDEFHMSKTLHRLIRSGRMEVRVDTCFSDVINSCANMKRKEQGNDTWITKYFIDSYCRLHEDGFAHSFETFLDGELVGGLYGVSISDYFCGDSMFHTATDASKVAFARMAEFALLNGFRFVDAQLYTDHLASLGAREIPRDEFLALLSAQDINKTFRGKWHKNTAVLSLGGNQGDRIGLLAQAMLIIEKYVGHITQTSAIYETEPWGFEADQQFLNLAITVNTPLQAGELLTTLLGIEKSLGRVRTDDVSDSSEHCADAHRTYSSRPIDIDIIFFNSELSDTPSLQLPHPRMHQRRFVLQPLVDIIPSFVHPKLKKKMRQLLAECDDKCEVKRYGEIKKP